MTPEPDAVPPPPGMPVEVGSVWPPPPARQAVNVTVPFRTLYRRVRGSVPNLRVGTLTLADTGLTAQGKSVLPTEWQIPIMAVAWLVNLGVRFVFLGVYVLLQYVLRRDETLLLDWEQVSEIVLLPKQRLACVVYEAHNFRGQPKVFSLTFRLNEAQFHEFAAAAERCLPGRVGSGKLRGWISPRLWIALGGLVLLSAYTAYRVAHGGMEPH